MAPDIILARRDIKITGQDQRRLGIALGHIGGQAIIEIHLVVEFRIALTVGRVAAGRDIEIVHLNALNLNRDRARMAFAAGLQISDRLKRQTRGYGHAVKPLLSANGQVRQAHIDKGLGGKFAVLALDFLQAQ